MLQGTAAPRPTRALNGHTALSRFWGRCRFQHPVLAVKVSLLSRGQFWLPHEGFGPPSLPTKASHAALDANGAEAAPDLCVQRPREVLPEGPYLPWLVSALTAELMGRIELIFGFPVLPGRGTLWSIPDARGHQFRSEPLFKGLKFFASAA